MKTLFNKSKFRGFLFAACSIGISPLILSAQTVDIGDFLVLEPDNQWYMAGDASLVYSGTTYHPEVAVTFNTSVGDEMHGVPTTRIFMEGGGTVLIVPFSATQSLNLSLDGSGLYLHSRIAAVYAAGALQDMDEEVYYTPAKLLPRLITVGHEYLFDADLTSGLVQDRVYVEKIEPVETSLGTIEAIKLVLFTEGVSPVTLWLGRNVGCMKAKVDTVFSGSPFSMTAILTGMNLPWESAPIDAMWAATVADADGWRFVDWFEYFWPIGIDSPWIYHWGLGWAYCSGDSTNLWLYLQGIGWLWTNEVTFPWVYHAGFGKYLYYIYDAGSLWFYDPSIPDYLDLTP
ncbi:MAG TPA: hypothetical protein VK995_03995 [Oceanipulchritudo sp.]|nr:hypothetical protein [Oceanipulchritudo sp.]